MKFQIDNINSEVVSSTWIFESNRNTSYFYPEKVLTPVVFRDEKLYAMPESIWKRSGKQEKKDYYVWIGFTPSEEELKEIIKQWQKKDGE